MTGAGQGRMWSGRLRAQMLGVSGGLAAVGALVSALLLACGGGSGDPLTELRELTTVPEGIPVLVFVYSDP